MMRRQQCSPRGVTLIELLIAMAITAIVVSAVSEWIIFTARTSARSNKRSDLLEQFALLRTRVFQDAHHAHVIEVSRDRWLLTSPNDSGEDTIVWERSDTGLVRNHTPLRLPDSMTCVRWSPVLVTPTTGDPWWAMDRDMDGKLSGTELDSVSGLDFFLIHAGRDTLNFRITFLGPG